jgi:hypothetical protein
MSSEREDLIQMLAREHRTVERLSEELALLGDRGELASTLQDYARHDKQALIDRLK